MRAPRLGEGVGESHEERGQGDRWTKRCKEKRWVVESPWGKWNREGHCYWERKEIENIRRITPLYSDCTRDHAKFRVMKPMTSTKWVFS